jgi:NAD+ synthase
MQTDFSKNILKISNLEDEIIKITFNLQESILRVLKRNGAIVGISGGIDSSVTLALVVRALGAENVIGIMLPEKDSSDESKRLAQKLADKFGVQILEEDITKALEGFACYTRRDEAVAAVFPEYSTNDYKMKIGVNPESIKYNLPPIFQLTLIDANGNAKSKIIPVKQYLQIVAASNFKQRCRMSMLYYHAERMHYAVVGTPNKHEVEQGFFVKFGDGGADIMPIAHLYKSQVYQIAEHLGVPQEILKRTPTTDTYPAEQTQQEFFYQLPFDQMDLLWYAYENKIEIELVANELSRPHDEIQKIFNNFARKQRTTQYLRSNPIFFTEKYI